MTVEHIQEAAVQGASVPGLIGSPEELAAAIREGVHRLDENTRTKILVEFAEATAGGLTERVSELARALLFTVRLAQNDEYRYAVKQVERMDEESAPQPLDRTAAFARLRAV